MDERRGRGDGPPDDEQRDGADDGDRRESGEGGGAWLRRLVDDPIYRFVFLFLVYLGVLAWAYPRLKARFPLVIDALAWGTARVEYAIFWPFTANVKVIDKVVTYDGFTVKIIEECTGIYEVLIFAAAVLAFPASLRDKAIGIALGAPLLYVFNVLRILVLILAGRHFPASFEFMHLYFWQATLILMITTVWLLWILKVVRREPRASLPA